MKRTDSVYCRLAVFIQAAAGALADPRVDPAVRGLSRLFRVVRVGDESREHAGTLAPRDVLRFIRDNSIEWYASWYIGPGPDIGFRSVLPLDASGGIGRAIRAVERSENRSRILVGDDRLAAVTSALKRAFRKIVFTNGVFDLLHTGHLRLLRRARELGDVLVVAINSDDSTRRIKGASRPVIPQFARAELLASLRQVDYCLIFTEPDPMRVLRIVRPDVLVKGAEYPLSRIVGAKLVTAFGGRVVRIPLVEGWSTTATIRGINARS